VFVFPAETAKQQNSKTAKQQNSKTAKQAKSASPMITRPKN